jgi:regulator of sigma E protease
MTTLWSFLLVLSGLIFVHELGHFLVARSLGITVLKFSIGFGPRLYGWVKNGTDYCISAIPLGGFVKMLGENPGEEVTPEEVPFSFSHRSPGERAAVVAAGPAFNFLFAWFVFFLILISMGNPVILPDIGSVQKESPAEVAGLEAGDVILSVNGVHVESWDDVSRTIKSGESPDVVITVRRDGKEITVSVKPELREIKTVFGEKVRMPVIGITAAGSMELRSTDPLSAAWLATERTWEITVMICEGIVKLFERVVPLSSLGGPIMIAEMAGKQAEQGMVSLFYFMALLSINLGLLNLLPIPVLDGGHLVFCIFEGISGKKLTLKQMQLAQQAGMVLLGSLMLLVFYNDIMRLLGFAPGLSSP